MRLASASASAGFGGAIGAVALASAGLSTTGFSTVMRLDGGWGLGVGGSERIDVGAKIVGAVDGGACSRSLAATAAVVDAVAAAAIGCCERASGALPRRATIIHVTPTTAAAA